MSANRKASVIEWAKNIGVESQRDPRKSPTFVVHVFRTRQVPLRLSRHTILRKWSCQSKSDRNTTFLIDIDHFKISPSVRANIFFVPAWNYAELVQAPGRDLKPRKRIYFSFRAIKKSRLKGKRNLPTARGRHAALAAVRIAVPFFAFQREKRKNKAGPTRPALFYILS